MVKFGEQLAINIVPEWRGAYVDYEALKRLGQGLGVIEKKHPILYSTVRPATGHVVADIMDDKFDTTAGAMG